MWSFYVVVSQRRAKKLSKIKNALAGRVERAEVIANQLMNYADYAANQSRRFMTFSDFPLLHSKCSSSCLNGCEA